MKRDGHVHTPYCPHGTNDSLEAYIEQAIKLSFTEITFTEHAPLPPSFSDPTPCQDSGMNHDEVEAYLNDIEKMKQKYADKIKINTGFEVDFIEGYEQETTAFLNEYGKYIDDSILSVHFLHHNQRYYCLDYSEQEFGHIARQFGSVAAVYHCYFDTLKQSIHSHLGPYKPNRIGHMTLVHKFQKQYPPERSFDLEVMEVLDAIKAQQLELDYNGAGAIKPLCGEPYPPKWIASLALNKQIPLIYGSDAHQASGLNQGYDQLIHLPY